MKNTAGLHFLGMGSAFNPAMDNTSAWFAKDGTFYLLDCGETVFGKIWDLEVFKNAKTVCVVLTHMHSDHIGSLGTLLSYCAIVVHKQVQIFYPAETLKSYLALVGIDQSFYTHHLTPPHHWSIHFEPYPVKHASDMACYGYVFEVDDQVIYYSGDSRAIPQPIVNLLMKDKLDVIFQDTSLEENEHHCPLRELEETIPEELRHKVFAMHIPDDESIDHIVAKGFKVVEL
ncbi:MAG: MBL fold metallo-hydrolase [Sphaerochaeta sp.]|jgi:mRNA degradation ribonuclease J1/J2